jgi:hypothetical protein
MRRYALWIFLTCLLWPDSACLADPRARKSAKSTPVQKQLLGYVEKVRLSPGTITLHAKLDTGADHCSLHARDIESFKRRGRTWVRFNVKNKDGKKQIFELPSHRTARIKRKGGGSQKRFVVRLGLCVGEHYREVDVNLVDRSNFSFPLLVGRSFLAGEVLIDSSLAYTVKPSCNFGARR